jgi:integrase
VPELTFHDLRHTGASLMIAARCHVTVIAERMGHSDGGTLAYAPTDTSTEGPEGRRQSRSNRIFSMARVRRTCVDSTL